MVNIRKGEPRSDHVALNLLSGSKAHLPVLLEEEAKRKSTGG